MMHRWCARTHVHTRSYLLTMRILSSLDVWFIVEIEGEASDEIYLDKEGEREEREREKEREST